MRKLFCIIILIANTIILSSEQAHSTEDSDPIEIVIIKDNTTVPVVKPMGMNTTFSCYYLNGYITIPLKMVNANVFVSVVNLFTGEYFGDDKFNDPICLNCSLLPICGGLCPAAKDASSDGERCPFDRKYIDSILEILYDIMQQAKDPESILVRTKKVIPNRTI